jgi:phosphoribosylformimino-5-aminoimidazole carboxamide ribotide isomerase
MKLIPAIDIINGKCVRLTKGDYTTKKIYSDSPVDVAKAFEDAGIKYLHVVDLDGAKSHSIVNHNVLNEIASSTNLIIDFGGGLKSSNDVAIAFENGASKITAGSIAVKDPAIVYEWIETYGPDKIILGADCLDRKIATGGWLETSDNDIISFITEYAAKSIEYVICTDISKDGMLQGPSIELYQEILQNTPIKLIASGGVSSIDDVIALKNIGCDGAIIGKAIYEGNITLKQLQELC